jgi:Peroxidase
VDLTDIHNRGLEEVIDILNPIVSRHEGNLTRGDIWSIAALVGAEVSQPDDSHSILDFEFLDYGRINCENIQRICRNQDGVSHGCSAKRGPFREIPGVHTTSHDLYAFFKEQFDFDTEETIAIMGAHTIGQLARENSGIDGKHGWVLGNTKLDNEYYFEIVGGKEVNDPVETLVNNAPKWQRFMERNPKKSEFGNVPVWHGLPEGPNGIAIVMLNIDMALVRDLDDDNLDSDDGRVSCKFVERDDSNGPVCPHLRGAIRLAARYKHDNELWTRDFERTLRKMMKAGYKDDNNNCVDGLCFLSRKVA